ncbi:beta-glucoside-specific PTS transporter subunit IIABC [Enterobacteriaceae bacterium LUAb1]
MEHKKVAEEILELIGKSDNIRQYWHCITRLRFNLHNDKKVNIDAIKAIPGVLGAHFQGDQLQIILGSHVSHVFTQLDKMITDKNTSPDDDSVSEKNHTKNTSFINLFFDLLSGIFTPVLPAIIGTGLLKGLLVLLDAINFIPHYSPEYKILYAISDSAFYFLPVLIAFSAAKKFKTNEFISATLACVLLYPIANKGELLSFLGIAVPNIQYTFTVIPIILGVWILSYVSHWVDKIIPASVKIIFSPLFILIITSVITLTIVAPLGFYIGEYLEKSFSWLFNTAGPIAGLIMGSTISLLVITGMHYAFFPATFSNFKTLGYDFVLLPISFVSNMAQAGATLAVAIKAKDKKLKSVAYSSSLTALFGITEPAIYGVTMKLKTPFYCALTGGGIGGAVVGAFTVKAFAFSLPGITALPTFFDKNSNNFIYICLAITLSFAIAFILTLFCKINVFDNVVATEDNKKNLPSANKKQKTPEKKKRTDNIYSPLSGEVIPLASVPDKVFSEKIIGDGIAIIPDDCNVVAPCNATISMIAQSKHAIGLTTDEGTELLIHIGIDTVSLNGEGFNVFVDEGQKVKRGDLLIEFDSDFIKSKLLSTITPVLVTNYEDYLSCKKTTRQRVMSNQDIILEIH